eukprot:s2343_g6.t2
MYAYMYMYTPSHTRPKPMADPEEQAASEKGTPADSIPKAPEPLPTLSCWERCFEVIATVITGIVFIAKLLQPVSIFIGSCALIWICWAILQFCRHGSRILFLWGIRVDQPNLRRSFFLPSLFAIFAIIFICVGAAVQGRKIVFDNWHLWLIFSIYPFYGVLQHVMLQAFLMRNLSWCVTGSDATSVLSAFMQKPGLLTFLPLAACVAVSAAAFAFVHWPDRWLMIGTGVMGVPWAVEYLLHRNVLPLGLYHGFLGSLFYFWCWAEAQIAELAHAFPAEFPASTQLWGFGASGKSLYDDHHGG